MSIILYLSIRWLMNFLRNFRKNHIFKFIIIAHLKRYVIFWNQKFIHFMVLIIIYYTVKIFLLAFRIKRIKIRCA